MTLAENELHAAAAKLRPQGFFVEQERAASGRVIDSGCILLTSKPCAWRCVFCDLWKHTVAGPVPPGAIPAQIAYALDRFRTEPEQVKLYNSGSFFDVAAVPPSDYASIAKAVAFAENVIVESHPRLVGSRTMEFAEHLKGGLEVAMGLETVHPQVLPRLNKRFDLEDFARAAEFLAHHGIALRAFVLIRPPFLAERDVVEWTVKSVEFAFRCGATAVSLIPTRAGTAALEALIDSKDFAPPSLSLVEQAFSSALAIQGGRVFLDVWDLNRFSSCDDCFAQHKARLETMNLAQQVLSPVICRSCG